MCDVDAQSLPDRHQSEWRSYQVLRPMMIEFQNFIHVLMQLKEMQVIKLQKNMSILLNIDIFIAFALDESVIHDVRQFFNSR